MSNTTTPIQYIFSPKSIRRNKNKSRPEKKIWDFTINYNKNVCVQRRFKY